MNKTNIFTLLISTEVPVMTQLSRILDNIIHMYYTVPTCFPGSEDRNSTKPSHESDLVWQVGLLLKNGS